MAKKFLATLLSFLLIVGMGNFAVLAEADAFTEGFNDEAVLSTWANDSNYGEKPAIDSTVKYEDKASVYFGDDASHSMYKRINGLEPKTTYVISFYACAEGTPDFYVYLAPSAASSVDYWYGNKWVAKATTGFEYNSIKYTTPADGSVSSFVVALKKRGAGGKVWIDKLTFAETDSLLDNADFENVIPVEGTSNLWAEAWTAASDDYRKAEDSSDTPNLAVITNQKARSGQYCLKTKTEVTNMNSFIYQQVTGLEVGAVYELSAWVLNEGVRNGGYGAILAVSPNKDDGFTTGWHNVNAQYPQYWFNKTENAWTKLSIFFKAQADKTYIKLMGNSGANSKFTTYFDDIVLKKTEGVSIDLSDNTGRAITGIDAEAEETVVRINTTAINDSATEVKPLCVVYGIYKSTINGTQLMEFGVAHAESLATTESGFTRLSTFKDIKVPRGHELKVMAFDEIGSLSPIIKANKLS